MSEPKTSEANAPTAVFDAQGIVAGYVPEVDILRGCNLSVGEGELVGIIGPNGAGKSTLVKALFGLVPVREGTVHFRGDDVTSVKAHELVRRGVGYVPQVRNVFTSLTIAEHLLPGWLVAVRADQVRAGHEPTDFTMTATNSERVAGLVAAGEVELGFVEGPDAPVGLHLADQLLIPMALSGGGSFRTVEPTEHTRTQLELIPKFLDVKLACTPEGNGTWRLNVSAR